MRQTELLPVQVEKIPDTIKVGLLYISEEYGVSAHLCPCGCGEVVYLTFPERKRDGKDMGWTMTNNNGKVTFRPSVGNTFKCRSHYHITENRIEWC